MYCLMLDLINPKIKRILGVLLSNREKIYHLKQLSFESKVPISTAFRIVYNLTRLNYIKIIRIGKIKLYVLNDNDKTKNLSVTK